MFRVLFSIAFFGAFRVGELVSPSRRVPGGLMLDDVGVRNDRGILRLRRSKTDQKGKGVDVQLFTLSWAQVCPLSVVQGFLGVRTIFVHQDGAFLSRFQFVAVFRQCLWAAGLDCMKFASHSFRIGAATEAAR